MEMKVRRVILILAITSTVIAAKKERQWKTGSAQECGRLS